MKFTPKYTVSYKGSFHKAGVAFQIDDKDAEMMAAHGVVEAPTVKEKPAEVSYPPQPEKPARRGGRPRKVVTE